MSLQLENNVFKLIPSWLTEKSVVSFQLCSTKLPPPFNRYSHSRLASNKIFGTHWWAAFSKSFLSLPKSDNDQIYSGVLHRTSLEHKDIQIWQLRVEKPKGTLTHPEIFAYFLNETARPIARLHWQDGLCKNSTQKSHVNVKLIL